MTKRAVEPFAGRDDGVPPDAEETKSACDNPLIYLEPLLTSSHGTALAAAKAIEVP